MDYASCRIHGLEEAMQAQVALFAALCLFAYVSVADTLDIKGYIYYQDYNEPHTYAYDSLSSVGCVAYPIDGAEVTLYKRTALSTWTQYGSLTHTDEGYYIFEDINVGRDASALCTNSGWFRVVINAAAVGCLPADWDYMIEMVRFSHNTVRPSGVPDAGAIRVDCVFESSQWTEYDGSSTQADIFQGHWIADDEGTAFSLIEAEGQTSCPIDSNVISCATCFMGHLSLETCFSEWEDEEDFMEFVVWPFGEDESDAFGWFYAYWSDDWPSYAFHENPRKAQQIVLIDYIEP